MAKIKLTESVSISELKHMREVEGLSNAEITKRVGCAVSTVIAHIGKQPVEMTKRNQMAGMRRVKQEEPSTPVGEPTKHHESFADLVARVKAEAAVEKNKRELGLSNAEPEPEVMKAVVLEETQPCRLEDLAREAYMKHEKEQKERTAYSEELHALVEELKVMFSPLSVLDYLKCKLYELGTPHIIYADREAYLVEIHRLIGMQEGVAQHD